MAQETITREVYGYCRVSTAKQKIERQTRNILAIYPKAKIYTEAYTGTKLYERKELNKLLKQVKQGDTIVFDSVSRMSRNADEGIELYLKLFDEGINLIFLKERHIDTDTYKSALNNSISLTGDDVDDILIGVNSYLKKLATKQIRLAFEQAQKEVDDLHQKTHEGIVTARANGKQIGQRQGAKLNVKKKEPAKAIILKHSKDFKGTLNDAEVIKLAGISRNTYYKYKKELANELNT
ncbi:MAG: recombinase family protein [Clostridiales bacterium]|nr:recombinase family protein [Clostridiales bacterium]